MGVKGKMTMVARGGGGTSLDGCYWWRLNHIFIMHLTTFP